MGQAEFVNLNSNEIAQTFSNYLKINEVMRKKYKNAQIYKAKKHRQKYS